MKSLKKLISLGMLLSISYPSTIAVQENTPDNLEHLNTKRISKDFLSKYSFFSSSSPGNTVYAVQTPVLNNSKDNYLLKK